MRGHLYEQQILRREIDLAQRFRTRIHGNAADTSTLAKSEVSQPVSSHFSLTDEQQAAVASGLSNQISLISGGPGTGKTSIIVAMIDAYLAAGMSLDAIALAAPTGKAAWRMTESIRGSINRGSQIEAVGYADRLGHSPYTVYWGFGSTGEFEYLKSTLQASVVIVDEASMLDTTLAERLLGALDDRPRIRSFGR